MKAAKETGSRSSQSVKAAEETGSHSSQSVKAAKETGSCSKLALHRARADRRWLMDGRWSHEEGLKSVLSKLLIPRS